MNYLMVVNVKYYRINENTVALESAFAEHLQLLKKEIKSVFSKLTVAMIEMNPDDYEKGKQSFAIIDERQEKIFFETIYSDKDIEHTGSWIKRMTKFYLVHLFPYLKRLLNLVNNCDLVHSGTSHLATIPIFWSIVLGIMLKKATICVTDIDFRNSAGMTLKIKQISYKSYLLQKYIYDQYQGLQIKIAVKSGSLVLLKGKQMCEYYGRGKPNVNFFLDAAHSEKYIITQDELDQKISKIKDSSNPLEIVYFGRLVAYKGIDRCIKAVGATQEKTKQNIIFHIIGSGEEEEQLRQLTRELGMENSIIFHGSLPYGANLFKKLYQYHLLLAAPLREDTPRSALDAMAAGIPILSFDTYYYKDLEDTGAVVTVPWLSTEQMGEKIIELNNDRNRLAVMMSKAVAFAQDNTQEVWLNQRFQWTIENMKKK